MPFNPDPYQGELGVTIESSCHWTGGDPDQDEVTYDVYFGTELPPPLVEQNQTETTYTPPDTLAYGTLYYWRIVAWDSYNVSTRGELWWFTTEAAPNQPPYAPSDSTPENGASNVSINPELSVLVTDPNDDDMDVFFYNASDDSLIGTDFSVPCGSRATTIWADLSYETTYYWYAIADDGEYQTQSNTWEFTTVEHPNNPPATPQKPTGPTLVYAENEHIYTTSTTDPEGHLVYYQWDWGDGNFSEWVGPFSSGLIAGAYYTWMNTGEFTVRVKAIDDPNSDGNISDGFESDWSEARIVTVKKPGDIDGNGIVNVVDLLELLAAWGQPGGAADINEDGIVNVEDLLILLAHWG